MVDPRIVWRDGLSADPGGYLDVTDSQLPRSAALNDGKNAATAPFRIWRFKPRGDLGPGD